MTDIPADIIARAAAFDHRWPLRPELADWPYRLKFWGRDEAALRSRLAAAGHPINSGDTESAWFRTAADVLAAKRDHREGEVVVATAYGRRLDGPFHHDVDGREICTLVAEIHLPDGRRHLLAYEDSQLTEIEGARYVWIDGGNWSCDCNRSLDLHRDGVRDLGMPLAGDGEPDPPCTPEGSNEPSLRLGWLVLRFRHLVTGAERFVIVQEPAEG